MSMVRALRTLTAMENGTLNASSLETLVSGSSARLDELRLLLSTNSLRTRILAGANVSAALRGSATAKALFDEMVTNVFDKTAWVSDMLATSGGRMLLHGNDTLLATLVSSSTLMAKARSSSKYSVVSASANHSNSVSLSASMTGTAYILLGISSAVAVAYGYNIYTMRTGGYVPLNTNTTADGNAMDADRADALVAPYSFTSVGGNVHQSYFGVLRCDA
jgi:hypothetical protein